MQEQQSDSKPKEERTRLDHGQIVFVRARIVGKTAAGADEQLLAKIEAGEYPDLIVETIPRSGRADRASVISSVPSSHVLTIGEVRAAVQQQKGR